MGVDLAGDLPPVTIDPARWHDLDASLRRIFDWTMAGTINAANVQKIAGLLVWVGRVISGSTTFIRGLHHVLQLLGATSLPAAQARSIVIYDHFLISEILHDITWWIDLCLHFRRSGCVPRGLRISEIISPRVFQASDCAVVANTDASEFGISGWWNSLDDSPGDSLAVFLLFHLVSLCPGLVNVVAQVSRSMQSL